MEGGDTGEYSHGVLKSMMNNECHSSFGFIFIPGWSGSSVGASVSNMGTSFSNVGGCCVVVVVAVCRGRS